MPHKEPNSMSLEPNSDKRRYVRFEIMEYAQIFEEGQSLPYSGVVVDVSLGGLQVRSRTQVQAGRKCMLRIGDSATPLCAEAEVRYSYPCSGSELVATGFRFTPSSPENRRAIVDYVHRVFQRQGDLLLG